MACILLLLGATASQAGTLAQFRTVFGDIEVELFDQDKPGTVQNFIRYVQSGRYETQISHRLIPGVRLEGGSYVFTNDVPNPISSYAPITNEFGFGPLLSNVYGTISMGRLPGDTNSATSHWFFNLDDNLSLDAPDADHSFVVFGRVVRGTNVLNVFRDFQYFNGFQSSNLVADLTAVYGAEFSECPLRFPSITSTNLLFIDISLLQVAITPIAGGREISWNSPANVTNFIEFTTNFPPVWNTLIGTNGNGSRMSVLDPSVDPKRFYRVRVAY